MIIKTFNIKDILLYILPGIIILFLMTSLYLFLDYGMFEGYSAIILICILPVAYIIQGIFLTIRRKNLLFGILISTIASFFTIFLYLNDSFYIYCFIYILLEVIASIFTNICLQR
ncbi:hypothetical protein ACQPU1_08745 [Clostridium paraputrificum]|uniref:hypothetical protein n=1 Tax=Clostridium TaxID=1485 RepID=UPI003D338FC6